MFFLLYSAVVGAMLSPPLGADARAAALHQEARPRILLDQSPRAIEYQLSRLTNDELLRVERREDEVKYRLVYYALLTRNGLPRAARDEALAALTKMDKTSPTQVLVEALGRLRAEDAQSVDQVLGMLLGQPVDTLRQQRETFVQAIGGRKEPLVLRGAYGALMIADGDPGQAWQTALAHEGHLQELLRSVRYLGTADELRAKLFKPVAALLDDTQNAALRADAVAALGWTRPDTATFDLLAREVMGASGRSDAAARAAAIHSLQLIPDAAWNKETIDPLAAAIVAMVRDAPPASRTEPSLIDAMQLGEKLAAALPEASRRTIRRDLRALGVQVVPITTIPEQLIFDLKWFAVEAGKPVQIVLSNPDGMPHNLIVGQPKSVTEIGTAASAVPPPSDPDVKPYVPESPLVLHATRLLNGGETERLNFVAPTQPGEYVFLCSFPGHWVRMYGVMLVVPNLEAWEANPTKPTDPLTNKPYESQR